MDREKEKKENASERGEHQKNAEGKTQAQTSNDIQKNLLVKRFASSRINDGHHQRNVPRTASNYLVPRQSGEDDICE